jgi:hypothetical protein
MKRDGNQKSFSLVKWVFSLSVLFIVLSGIAGYIAGLYHLG